MVIKRKKTTIDGMDREILRTILNARRQLTGNQIAKKVKLTPSAIRPRLDNLQRKGIVKKDKILGTRSFKRTFGKNKREVRIKSPRSIFWDIDFKKRSPQRRRPIKRKATPPQLRNLAKGRRMLAQKRKKR